MTTVAQLSRLRWPWCLVALAALACSGTAADVVGPSPVGVPVDPLATIVCADPGQICRLLATTGGSPSEFSKVNSAVLLIKNTVDYPCSLIKESLLDDLSYSRLTAYDNNNDPRAGWALVNADGISVRSSFIAEASVEEIAFLLVHEKRHNMGEEHDTTLSATFLDDDDMSSVCMQDTTLLSAASSSRVASRGIMLLLVDTRRRLIGLLQRWPAVGVS